MALFQPSQLVPDVRSGLGYGTIDADRTFDVSWRVNGANAMTAFAVAIYRMEPGDTTPQFVYGTGELTDGCPFYGTTPSGEARTFTYTMPAIAALNNGDECRMIVTQYWGNGESVVQNSASVFFCRSTPTLNVDPIGVAGVVADKAYTFTGTYTQAEGDVLNWFRWRIAPANDLGSVLYDSGNVSGTMDIQMTYDGLFTGEQYAVRLEAQTQYGVGMDTGWVGFSADYGTPTPSEDVTAECAQGTNAVLVSWGDIGSGLQTPTQSGALTYTGSPQSPTWNNYIPSKMTIGGTTSATNAGTYTATFTPTGGNQWSGGGVPGMTAWSIYRRDANGRFVHLADVPAEAGKLYDYGAASRQGPYTYYVFPIQSYVSSGETVTVILGPPIYSNTVYPCFSSWSLMEAEDDGNGNYTVTTEYLFRYNFSSSAMSNNNKPSVERNFTQYPTLFKAPQNYRSGSITGLIGVVDYTDNARYSDTLTMRDRIFALSTTKNKLFLKSRKGDVIYIGISDPITASTADETFEQTQTVAIPWVEIGPSGNLLKLTALGNANAGTGDQLSPDLTVTPSFVALNMGDTFSVKAVWKGGGVLSVSAPPNLSVAVNGDTIEVTALAQGKNSVDVTVSASGKYVSQTVPLTIEAIGGQPVPIPYTNSSFTYNGNSQSPVWIDYDPDAMNMGGTTSATNAGNYQAVFTLKQGYIWNDGSLTEKTVTWSIAKAQANLTVSPSSLTLTLGETADLEIAADSDGDITAVSSDPSVATVSVTSTSGATVVQPPAQSSTLRYNGSVQTPTWTGYDPTIMTLSGQTSGTTPGSYGAVFTLASGYVWAGTPGGAIGTVTGVSGGNASITVSISETQNYYPDSVTVDVTVMNVVRGFLRFSSENSFTLETANRAKNWDGAIEWRAGNGTWEKWDGATQISSVNGTLDLRGTGNTVITGNGGNRQFVLTGSNIRCMGNIEDLLDYAVVGSGSHPAMANYCFTALFSGCSALITAPMLPAETLTDYCYNAMFSNCTSLRSAPALFAPTMTYFCYASMFSSCTSLTSPPAISATTPATSCFSSMFLNCSSLEELPALHMTAFVDRSCAYMFYNCANIKLSTVPTGDYQTAYRIPISGTGTMASNSFEEMFTGTGGTFAGTPTINTTYYTDHEPVS